jgi:chloramphenicol-sensitive protein RarD
VGALYALAAYGIWGFAPIYWVETRSFPAPELLAYRVISSLAVALLFIALLRGWRALATALRSRRSAATAALAGLLLGVNWLTFIWAVQHRQILATSLGYFINPLVNVLLGMLILRERLSRAQTLAVLVAALGVAFQTFERGELPWIALILASSFGLYGLVRKLGAARRWPASRSRCSHWLRWPARTCSSSPHAAARSCPGRAPANSC